MMAIIPMPAERGPLFPVMTIFRPCIDLHRGRVKQIVGATLADDERGLVTNFVSDHGADWFARRFRDDDMRGGHVIQLGPGNEEAACAALAAWPGGLQIGGGIGANNAELWIARGASHVIVTSCLFDQEGRFMESNLRQLAGLVGPGRLVVDLSCRRRGTGWVVAMNRWQTLTNLELTHATLDRLRPFCAEFLIHAADVEGLQGGIDADLVRLLAHWGQLPVTYAGGARSLADVETIDDISGGRIDVTVGSALDLFGGGGVRYEELVAFNRRVAAASGDETISP